MRVFSSDLGIFKGVLVKKQGINKIQLPNSMKKVEKSTIRDGDKEKKVYLLFNSVFPSKLNSNHERYVNPRISSTPTKDATEQLKKGLGTSVPTVLIGCGVSVEEIEDYTMRSIEWKGREHASLVGVSDCTDGGIPEGKVFVTGGAGMLGGRRKIALTRIPCTGSDDIKMLEVVYRKPRKMSKADWAHINSLSFGAIMFGSPTNATDKSLPELINNSDLDGDHFCVIWDRAIVSHVQTGQQVFKNAQSSDAKLADSDECIGIQRSINIYGEAHEGIVTSKLNDGRYIVKSGHHENTMTREEILDGRSFISEVVGHKGRGLRSEVQVLWENETKSWQSFQTIKNDVPDILADYALTNDLLKEPKWRWARDYCHVAEIVEISKHKFTNSKVQFEVVFDGALKTEWKDPEDIDALLLEEYVEQNYLAIESTFWQDTRRCIQDGKADWFAQVQKVLPNVRLMVDFDRFKKKLHRLWREKVSTSGVNDSDTIALGSAFKQALVIQKHGGRVSLPPHLRELVLAKKSSTTIQFIKFE